MFDRLSWLLLVACVALPTSAQAQQHPDQTNAVVVFAAEGQFRFSVMVYMRRHIHQSLKDIGIHPLAGMSIWEKLPKPRYRELDTCIDEADCLERIRAQVDAQYIMLVSIARTKGEPFAVRLRISGPAGQGRSHRFEAMKLWPLYQTTAQTVKSAWSAYERGEREVLPEPVERQQSTESTPEGSVVPVADTVSEPAYPPVAAPVPADVAEPAAEEVTEAVLKESAVPEGDTVSEPAAEEVAEAVPKESAVPEGDTVSEPAAEEVAEAVPKESAVPEGDTVSEPAAEEVAEAMPKESAVPEGDTVSEPTAEKVAEAMPKESATPVADTVSEPALPPVAAPVPADVAEPAAEEVAEAVPEESAAPLADTVFEPAAEEIPEAVPEALVTHGAEEPQLAVEPVMEPAAHALDVAQVVRDEPRRVDLERSVAVRRKPRPRRPSRRQSTSAGGYKVSMVDLMDAGADWSGGVEEPEAVADEWTAPESTEWEGDVVIKRLEDLEELAGYAKINGSVTIQIGSRASLDALWMLEVIDGDLRIEKSPAILDLRGLEQLSEITGSLIVSTNASLLTLKGLNNVSVIGGDIALDRNGALIDVEALTNIRRIRGQLAMTRNRSLWSLSGFRHVTDIGGDLTIANNSSLMDLMGLDQLRTVGGSVVIERNDGLASLNGLSSLTRVGRGIAVSDHGSLRDIARLKSLQSVTGDIAFISNPVLPACSVDIFEYSLKKAQVSGSVVQRFNDARAGCGRSSVPER